MKEYTLEGLEKQDSDHLLGRVLNLVRTKDEMFTCIDDGLISDLIIHDFIVISLDNETMEGTSLTEKGLKFWFNNFHNL